jgi:hypothetical protein
MTLKSIILTALIVFLLPGFAGAVSEEDFRADTTRQLLNLCTAAPDDPLYHQAINFCHGYLVGAFHYYEAVSSGPKGVKFVCPPDPRPSRNESIGKFIEWVEANPEHLGDAPVETEFKFLMEHWPCKP